MFKYFKALSVAGLATIGASQSSIAGADSVLWSQDKKDNAIIVSGIKEAARTMGRLNQQHPIVRFTGAGVGSSAIIPILPYESGERCSPDFDPTPFVADKGNEVWANFEFLNIEKSDQGLLAFAVKADKPGRKDRFRVAHDIGSGRLGNKPAMTAMVLPPTEGDYGYYFVDRGLLKADDIVRRNPGAAIRITISNHARGPVV